MQMDPKSQTAKCKRKKYTKRSLITIDKKSKRYHFNRSCQSASVSLSQDESSTSDSTTDNKPLSPHLQCNHSGADNISSDILNSKSEQPLKCDQDNNSTHQQHKSKCIQVKPVFKAVSVQASCQMKCRSVQTLHNKSIHSCGIQTDKIKKKNTKTPKLTRGEMLKNR